MKLKQAMFKSQGLNALALYFLGVILVVVVVVLALV